MSVGPSKPKCQDRQSHQGQQGKCESLKTRELGTNINPHVMPMRHLSCYMRRKGRAFSICHGSDGTLMCFNAVHSHFYSTPCSIHYDGSPCLNSLHTLSALCLFLQCAGSVHFSMILQALTSGCHLRWKDPPFGPRGLDLDA